MICEGCTYASWKTNAKGHKHPDGTGHCLWSKKFRVAGSAQSPGSFGRAGQPVEIKGGYICRKRGEEYPVSCDVYQPEKPRS